MTRSLNATVKVGVLLVLVVAGLYWAVLGPTEAGSGPRVLSGTVTDVANIEIADVLVEVIDGTNTVVGSDTTDIDGDYSVTALLNATYTVKATPPVASDFVVTTILNVVVSGNTTRDIVLVLPTPSTYSGTVRNGDGEPLRFMTVRLSAGTLVLSSGTDINGAFSIEAAPAQYDLDLRGNVEGPDGARASLEMERTPTAPRQST